MSAREFLPLLITRIRKKAGFYFGLVVFILFFASFLFYSSRMAAEKGRTGKLNFRSPGAQFPMGPMKYDMQLIDPKLLDLSYQYQPVKAEIDKNLVGSLSTVYINSADSGMRFQVKGDKGTDYWLIATPEDTIKATPVIDTGNTISYDGIFPGVNLTYHLFDGYLKEDIIVQGPNAPQTFTYKLEYGDNILFDISEGPYIKAKDKNTNEDIFMLRTPQGIDQKNQRIDYAYTLKGNILTLYPSRSWQYDQAVFPVTIVPSLSVIDWDEAAVSVGNSCPGNECEGEDGSIGDIQPAGYNWAKDARTKAVIVKIPKLSQEEREEYISKTRETPPADISDDEEKLSDLSPRMKERIFTKDGLARYGIDYTKLATPQELALIRDLKKDKFSPVLDASHDKRVIIKKNNPLLSVIPKEKILAYQRPAFTDKIGKKLIPPAKAAGTITKTIGATGRNYTQIGGGTTCTAGVTWEACEDGDLVSAQEIHVGEMYKDSTFTITTGQQAIDGSTTNSSYYMHLTAAASDRHNGTAGTGVVIDFNGGAGNLAAMDPNTVVDWLEIKNIRGSNGNSLVGSTADGVLFQNLILHDFNDPTPYSQRAFRTQASGTTFRNTIIYDGGAQGLRGNTGFALTVQNLTIYGIGAGINEDGGTFTVTNTISMNNTGADFAVDNGSLTNVLCEDNLSDCNSGTLTTCTNCLYNKSASTQFTSTTAGSEDFHLAATSDAINAGTSSLAGSFTTDIIGTTRPEGSAWDIGAFERILATPTPTDTPTPTNTPTPTLTPTLTPTPTLVPVPTLSLPADGATGVSLLPIFSLSGTDPQSDYLKYKIEISTSATDPDFTTNIVYTADGTISATGWGTSYGAYQPDTPNVTGAFNSGTTVSLITQTALTEGTAYYWRAYLIDPGGSDSWSTPSVIRSFTTALGNSSAPVKCVTGYNPTVATDNLTIKWINSSTTASQIRIEKSVNGGAYTLLTTVSDILTTSTTDTVTSGSSYTYRIQAQNTATGINSGWCTTSAFSP